MMRVVKMTHQTKAAALLLAKAIIYALASKKHFQKIPG